jgi:hypothetical protein
VQWHWYNCLRFQLAKSFFGMSRPNLTHGFGQQLSRRMLHPQDHVAQPTFVRPKAQRARKGQRNIAALPAPIRQIDKWSNRTAATWAGEMRIGRDPGNAIHA